MQTIDMTRDLSVAIDYIEDLLNNYDGEKVLELIKDFKNQKEISEKVILDLLTQQ